jgi:hypothetical protein
MASYLFRHGTARHAELLLRSSHSTDMDIFSIYSLDLKQHKEWTIRILCLRCSCALVWLLGKYRYGCVCQEATDQGRLPPILGLLSLGTQFYVDNLDNVIFVHQILWRLTATGDLTWNTISEACLEYCAFWSNYP